MNIVNSQFEPSNIIAEFPLSVTQQQFWFLDQLRPGNPALNVAVAWDVHGNFNARTLERAYRFVINRHEILRSRFVEKDGQVLQQVLDHVDFNLDLVDLRTMAGQSQADRLAEIASDVARQPFDLSNCGLLRATLVQISDDHARLLTVAHHAVFDGFSIGVMGREIGLAAAAYDAGKLPEMPELPLQFGDFCLWQEEYLASGVMDRDTEYWREQMQDSPYFEVPSDFPRPKARNTEIRYMNLPLQDDFAEQIDRIAKDSATSRFVVGAAISAGALHRFTGEEEILFGTPIIGRSEVELESLIGPFINTQVLRLKTAKNASFSDLLTKTKSAVEGMLVHQNLPFSKLVEVVNPVRDASRAPLVSMNFNLQHVFMQDETYGKFNMISKPTQTPGASRDLDIVIIGRPTGWRLNIEYSPSLYADETIATLLKMIKQSFAYAFSNPDFALSEFPLLKRESELAPQDPIATALKAHSLVSDAVTVPYNASRWGFVTPDPSKVTALETLPAVLNAHVLDQLKGGEPLSGISVLANFPKDANGQIAISQLPLPQQTHALQKNQSSESADVPELKSGLIRLWSQLLEQPTVPTDKSFFDLGGHSLLAVRMVANIRKTWNIQLTVAAIYDHSSIDDLMEFLSPQLSTSCEADADDWRIEPIRTDGTGQPIVSVNDISVILSASDHFKQPRPAFCVRLFDGKRGIDQTERSFEEIAVEYANVIEAAQPRGPYLFYGACVHGNIALEAARHLQSKGHVIEGVVIKDCWEPGYAEGIRTNRKMRRREKVYALMNRVRQVRSGKLSLTAMLGSYRVVRNSGLLQLARKVGLIDRVRSTDMTAEQEGFVAYISKARNVYRPKPVDFPVLHVVTKITPVGRGFLPSIGWEKVVGPSLKTVGIDDVSSVKGNISGTDQLAEEIEIFLAK